MENYTTSLELWLEPMGVSGHMTGLMAAGVAVLTVVLALWVLHQLLTRVAEPLIRRVVSRTDTKLDDVLIDSRSMRWAWLLVECVVADITLPTLLTGHHRMQDISLVVIQVMMILAIMMMAIELVRRLFIVFTSKDEIDQISAEMQRAAAEGRVYQPRVKSSLRGLVQMIVVIIVGISIVLIISTLIGKNPLLIFSGLGAMAAVLLLVFQDSILGVVAGVQITANKMLEPDDWIVAPKFGANGKVIDVSLAAVKVLNWDNSITTIPPYKLLTEGFQNWNNMFKSRGRRVARAINIDMATVAFATPEQTERWSREPWWRQPASSKVVNVTALRMYLEHYIKQQPTLAPDTLYMVRELDPTPEGLPVEMYFFTTQTEWPIYEALQAEVFDHVIATLPDFGLRIYQHAGANLNVSLHPGAN